MRARRFLAGIVLILAGCGMVTVLANAHGTETEQQRYAGSLTPLLDAAEGKTIGSVLPGTAVNVVGESGTATHVVIHGWVANDVGAVVLQDPKQHVTLLTGFTGHSAAADTQAVGSTTYRAVTVDGWVATSTLVNEVETSWKHADDLLKQSCASCHALPEANAYSADQWPAIMKTQADNAGLDPNDTALLIAYLQRQSGK